jgi:phosphate starvation-inducible PhoH-like protein
MFVAQYNIYHDLIPDKYLINAAYHIVNIVIIIDNDDNYPTGDNMGRRRNSALRKEQDMLTMISNKHNQIYHQKNNYHKTDAASNVIQIGSSVKKRSLELVPKSLNQEKYILALTNENTDVVVVSGPAGTGKTYLAMLTAIQAFRNKQCERIVLTRPAISVDDEKHGFLPGSLNQKMEPWTRPLLDVLREYYSVKDIEYMIEEQIVEIAPLAFMRGRTFSNCFIILDEGQNATPAQIKMLLTRIGSNSKIVITGDTDQSDRITRDNGLADLCSRINKSSPKGIELCGFDQSDIQRHPIITQVLNMYK